LDSRPDVVVRPARSADLDFLAKNLRQDDIDEITHASGMLPREALEFGFVESSVCHVALFKGEPFAIFGLLAPAQTTGWPQIASVWMLGTRRMSKLGLTLCRLAPEWLQRHGGDYDILNCMAWCGNVAHLKWLKAMDFQYIRRFRHGQNQAIFAEFALIKEGIEYARN